MRSLPRTMLLRSPGHQCQNGVDGSLGLRRIDHPFGGLAIDLCHRFDQGASDDQEDQPVGPLDQPIHLGPPASPAKLERPKLVDDDQISRHGRPPGQRRTPQRQATCIKGELARRLDPSFHRVTYRTGSWGERRGAILGHECVIVSL